MPRSRSTIVLAFAAVVGAQQEADALARLGSKEAPLRVQALGDLAARPATTAAVAAVALALADAEPDVRNAAVDALLALRPDLSLLRPRLVALVAPRRQEMAVQTTCMLGVPDDRDPGPLADQLRSADAATRRAAVEGLCEMGPRADPHAADLAALLADPALEVREAVAKGIGALTWTTAIRDALALALGDREAAVREAAAETLTPRSRDARVVEAVRGVIQDPSPRVRAQVLRALAASGPFGAPAAGEIVAMVRDRDAMVRTAALFAVARQGLRDERAVGATVRCLDDKDESVLVQALAVVEGMGAAAAAAAPQALQLTRSPRVLVRTRALGAMFATAAAPGRGAAVLRLVEVMLDPVPAPSSQAEGLLDAFVHGDLPPPPPGQGAPPRAGR